MALLHNGQLLDDHRIVPRQHNQLVLQMIDSLLQRAQVSRAALEGVVFGAGPGSFTGLRIAAGVAQGIAYGLNLPVLPLSSLAALAVSARMSGPSAALNKAASGMILTTVRARPGELYRGLYQITGPAPEALRLVDTEAVLAPQDVVVPERSPTEALYLVGDAWSELPNALLQASGVETLADVWPSAAALLRLSERCWDAEARAEPEAALPRYLQPQLPWRKLGEQQSGN